MSSSDVSSSEVPARRTRFRYIRDDSNPYGRGFPMACVAYREADDGVRFGLSIYNPKDQFSRTEARKEAEKRMETSEVLPSSDDSKDSFYRVAQFLSENSIATKMSNTRHCPKYARSGPNKVQNEIDRIVAQRKADLQAEVGAVYREGHDAAAQLQVATRPDYVFWFCLAMAAIIVAVAVLATVL